MTNSLRRNVSDRLKNILRPDSEKRRYLVGRGVTEDELSSLSRPRISKNDVPPIECVVERVLDLGGVISGGAALAALTGEFTTKDIDCYFSDEAAYVHAWSAFHDDARVDVCLFVEDPCELHDLSIVRVNLSQSGFDVKPDCMQALGSGISDIYNDRVIYPDRTLARVFKYHERLGMRYSMSTALVFAAVNRLAKREASHLLELAS